MNIDQIKWAVGYADGFEWETYEVNTGRLKTSVKVPQSKNISFWYKDAYHSTKPIKINIKSINQDGVYYPLLLTRAIEGVNRDDPNSIQIAQCGYCIQILCDGNRDVLATVNIKDYPSIDKAKESALIYVYEQEIK